MRGTKLSLRTSPTPGTRAVAATCYIPMVCDNIAASPAKRSHDAENPPVLHRPGRGFRARIRAICARLTVSSDITPALPWWLRPGYLTVGE